ncbi:GNAT family N-acetyltransferase [Halobacillus sp. A1]|uniref:GNAT family N-acetyltransferase n=1 Tax=Halobacillus campisalis TaxID=435909 RepID=A0ABW2JZR9_9BACI|nr:MULTISPECIES: GNAT family N-acetyltransferase [Halobacillus]MCP3030945.1 GNAT family N-acetyltransferase [Halobacillus sp. A1]
MIELKHVVNREEYLPYLLLADEDEEKVMDYIQEGELYAIVDGDQVIGACLFTFPSPKVVEIKNIAVIFTKQGKGIGTSVIQKSFSMFQDRGFSEMIVGTANSSLANISFYQRCGFRMDSIRKDFFLDYPEPIYENGILATDMIVFSRDLS